MVKQLEESDIPHHILLHLGDIEVPDKEVKFQVHDDRVPGRFYLLVSSDGKKEWHLGTLEELQEYIRSTWELPDFEITQYLLVD